MKFHVILSTIAATVLAILPAQAGVRIKDLIEIEGAHTNTLEGLGLVVGLKGTGTKNSSTHQMAVDLLQRFGISTKVQADGKGDTTYKSSNIALVVVNGELGPFSRRSSYIDVTVSVLDDSTSLEGGRLLGTPLRGVDKVDYAYATGNVFVGGYSAAATAGGGGAAAGVVKNHPTVGQIKNGALVVTEALAKVECNGQIKLLLRPANVDYATARAIAKTINDKFPASAFALDPGTVHVFVPRDRCTSQVAFIGEIGLLEIDPGTQAVVIINERTGTIIAGEKVRIATVAISHGNLAIVTSNDLVASQPAPFSKGKTAILPRASLNVAEQGGVVRVLEQTITVGELARALNSLGASPRDLISIFVALDNAGALHAMLIYQ